MVEPDNRKGTLYLVGAVSVFAAQDGISRHLGVSYNVFSIVMLRYWVFVLFGLWLMDLTLGWHSLPKQQQF